MAETLVIILDQDEHEPHSKVREQYMERNQVFKKDVEQSLNNTLDLSNSGILCKWNTFFI